MAFSLFPSYFEKPPRIRFATQENDEHIELFLRQHWVTNVPWVFFSLLGLLLPVFLILSGFLNQIYLNTQIPLDILTALIILWYLLILVYIVEHYLYWYFNIYIVTDKNIVDMAFQNLMNLYSTEVRLTDVQSSRYRYQGLLGSLFNYGDVNILTAAERQQIDFLAIPKPDLVRDRIQDLQEGIEGGRNHAPR